MTDTPTSTTPIAFDAPIAETLDEPTLRATFPGSPADLTAPKGVGSMFGARMRDLRRRHGTPAFLAVATAIVASILLLLGGHVGAAIAIAVILVIVLAGIGFWQHGAAADSYFDAYAAARGLEHAEGGSVPAHVPLLRRGDKRKFPRVLTGPIAGQPARLAQYTYTEVSTDSDGNRTETDHDFTILAFELPPAVAARYRGVSLAPRSLSFGKLQDWAQDDRKVELESAAFAKRCSLRAHDQQDDIALWELFSTTFVDLLATSLEVTWEQRDSDLVIWRKRHMDETAELDRFCLEGFHVLHRYLEEYR